MVPKIPDTLNEIVVDRVPQTRAVLKVQHRAFVYLLRV